MHVKVLHVTMVCIFNSFQDLAPATSMAMFLLADRLAMEVSVFLIQLKNYNERVFKIMSCIIELDRAVITNLFHHGKLMLYICDAVV